jgi:hypothetical protein
MRSHDTEVLVLSLGVGLRHKISYLSIFLQNIKFLSYPWALIRFSCVVVVGSIGRISGCSQKDNLE